MIVRLTDARGNDSEVAVSTSPYPNLTPHDLATAIMAGLPEVARIRVWDMGRSFLDPPDADLNRAEMPVVVMSPDLIDIATAVKLRTGEGLDGIPNHAISGPVAVAERRESSRDFQAPV
ncbi:hypothetical protein [Pseudofrankia asymbiotica]|uniref:Uncharacterized protein n=1 Tax=Pseudofrankia asymbiotica TaxID=1834516 RepID=A0A1V2I3F7_9ACTN|nr:hypothetical protein [Pseudofrankia asymbiotica]ONH24878.1 hypothetical protein BL253_28810 [Pseudofrankia asymbiotica]